MTYELADFDPTTGHLHTCMAEGDPEAGCAQDCAGILYAIAQDAEIALARLADTARPSVIDRMAADGATPAHPKTMAGRSAGQSTTDPLGEHHG